MMQLLLMDEQLKQLLDAAIRALSGDNLRPWRFVVDNEARRISLYIE